MQRHEMHTFRRLFYIENKNINDVMCKLTMLIRIKYIYMRIVFGLAVHCQSDGTCSMLVHAYFIYTYKIFAFSFVSLSEMVIFQKHSTFAFCVCAFYGQKHSEPHTA